MRHNTSRRDLFWLCGASGLLAAMGSQYGCAGGAVTGSPATETAGIGLQLYTIRDAMAADPSMALKRVAKMGYKYLELASYSDRRFYGVGPLEFRRMCADFGLEAVSSHTQVEGSGVTLDNAKAMAEDHAKLGVKYCVQPWVVEEMRTIPEYHRMAANWNKVGSIMKSQGIQFAYHNHNFEFASLDGKVPYFDILMAELDKDLVAIELDLFWLIKAGQNPVDLVKRYPGRCQLFHMKDMYSRQAPFFNLDKSDMGPVGQGVIDFKSILAVRETAGVRYMFVEEDESRLGDPFGDCQKSITNLRRLLAS